MNNKQNRLTINKLNTLCSDIIDCSHSTPVWRDRGIRVIRNFNLNEGSLDFSKGFFVDEKTYLERTKRAVPEAEDIVISREAPMGTVAIIPNDLKCCLGQRLVLLKVDNNICSSSYLLFALMSDFVQNQFNKIGSTVSNLTIPELKETKIPLVKNHKSIGKLLESIANKIQVNKQINDNLAAMIKTIYEYWFVQFEFPDKNGNPYKSSGGKMVWNEQLKKEIPDSWRTDKLLNIVSWESNSQPPKSEFIYSPKDGYVRFIQNRDYENDSYRTYIPLTNNLSTVNRFDILMDKYGDAGTVRYGIEGAFNVALGKINVLYHNFQEYVRSFLESDGVYSYLHNSCMASTRASLNESNLDMLNIVIPDENSLLRYQEDIHQIRETILLNNSENQNLISLRDWLLPMLINGQATIED